MSTLAIWLFILVGVLLVGAVIVVVLAARSTLRKGGRLMQEVGALSDELDESIGSRQRTGLDE